MNMRVKLNQCWTDRLLESPESGMGYQRVDIRFADGHELKDVVVFNAEELNVPDELAKTEIKEIKLHSA